MTFAETYSFSAFEKESRKSPVGHVDLLSRCWELKQTFADLGLQQQRESCRIKEERERTWRSRFSHSRVVLLDFVSAKKSQKCHFAQIGNVNCPSSQLPKRINAKVLFFEVCLQFLIRVSNSRHYKNKTLSKCHFSNDYLELKTPAVVKI